jgi:hypothetical protein
MPFANVSRRETSLIVKQGNSFTHEAKITANVLTEVTSSYFMIIESNSDKSKTGLNR